MKHVIATVLLLVISISFYAQQAALTIQPAQVKAKTEIEFTYSGKLAKAGTEVRAVFFQLKGGANKVIKTELKGNKLVWKLNLSDSVVYVLFGIKNGSDIDTNNGRGFGFHVYKKGKVIPGSYAAEGLSHLVSKDFGIKKNVDKAVEIMDKDFALNPTLKANETAAMWYILGLTNTAKRKQEGVKLAKKTFDNLMQQKTESMFVGEFARQIDPQMGTTYDSLLNVIVQHFPKGMVSYNLKSIGLQKTNDPDKILELYAALQKEFPDKCKNYQQQLNRYLVIAYRKKKDYVNFEKYLTQKKDDKWFQAEQLNELAWELTTANTELSAAKQYSERSLAAMDSIAKAGKTEFDSQQEWEESVNKTKGNYYDTYANIFYNQGNKQQAAENEQKATDLSQGKNSYINEMLVKYLIESNQPQVALDRAEQFKITQQSTAKLDSMFTVTYLALHGQEALNAAKIRIASQLKDAPDFTLKTMVGKSVTLSALKGKIVILDFWATWCGPCVSSFPGMQKAMDALKDNKDVCFYFINTFERVSPEERLAKIKSTLEAKNVHFDVLLDNQVEDHFEVSELYDVKSIPTKIIIDKNGKLYTKLVGYGGNDEELVKELKGVVEGLK